MKEKLVRKFDASDTQTIFISSFQIKAPFSKGFGIMYDNVDDGLKCELKHWLAKNGLKGHVDKTTKESKNRAKKIRGIKTTKKI